MWPERIKGRAATVGRRPATWGRRLARTASNEANAERPQTVRLRSAVPVETVLSEEMVRAFEVGQLVRGRPRSTAEPGRGFAGPAAVLADGRLRRGSSFFDARRSGTYLFTSSQVNMRSLGLALPTQHGWRRISPKKRVWLPLKANSRRNLEALPARLRLGSPSSATSASATSRASAD